MEWQDTPRSAEEEKVRTGHKPLMVLVVVLVEEEEVEGLDINGSKHLLWLEEELTTSSSSSSLPWIMVDTDQLP